jgi:hypothetical protein
MKQGINMQKKTSWGAPLNVGLLALAGLVLTGCGKQAPDCTSGDTGKTLKGIVAQSVIATVNASGALPNETKAKVEKYLDGIKLAFGTTVETAYDKEAKLRSCQGQYSLSTPTGEKWEVSDSQWSAQVTSDGKDFVVKLPQLIASNLGSRVYSDLRSHLIAEKKLAGSWVGSVICPRPEGEDSTAPAQKEFPLTLSIDVRAQLDGKTLLQSGGHTDFSGNVDPFTDEVSIDLAVMTPEGSQKSRHGPYTGKLNGNALQMKLGACSVDLKRQ